MALLLQLTQKLAHGFDSFWSRWPKKVGKYEAKQTWERHVRPEDEDLIHAALDWQVPIFEQREWEYIPHAKTWLRNRRWEDERPAPPKAPLTDEQKRVLARIQSHLPQPRGPLTEAQAEVRARLKEEWGRE